MDRSRAAITPARRRLLALALLALLPALAACGNKGDLVRPEPEARAQAR